MLIWLLKKLLKVAKLATKLNLLQYPSRTQINQKTLYLTTFPGLKNFYRTTMYMTVTWKDFKNNISGNALLLEKCALPHLQISMSTSLDNMPRSTAAPTDNMRSQTIRNTQVEPKVIRKMYLVAALQMNTCWFEKKSWHIVQRQILNDNSMGEGEGWWLLRSLGDLGFLHSLSMRPR